MQTRIGILTGSLTAEQAESLAAAVQDLVTATFTENGYGSGNVRLETREFVYTDDKTNRVDTRKDTRVEATYGGFETDTEDDETVEFQIAEEPKEKTGLLGKLGL